MKECTACKDMLDLDKFGRSKKGKDGLKSECRKCENIRSLNRRRTKDGLVTLIAKNQRARSKKKGFNPPEYTTKELIQWINEQDSFNDMYNEWVNSGYDKNLTPSIDRINDYIGYRFGNIQLMTWAENNKKGIESRRSLSNTKNNTRVSQFKDGVSIRTFSSILEAERITGIHNGNIASVCRGERKTAGGYEWIAL